MNCFLIGTHKTGKSTKAVKVITYTRPPKIWLVAANPNQRDGLTGKLTFPENFIRTDESIFLPERTADRQNSAILLDDTVALRRRWKEIEQIFATPRQNAVDIYIAVHDYALVPTQLASYCNIAYCFRTSNDVPPYSSWGMKREMKQAAKILRERGTRHSYYVFNIYEGTIKVVLKN